MLPCPQRALLRALLGRRALAEQSLVPLHRHPKPSMSPAAQTCREGRLSTRTSEERAPCTRPRRGGGRGALRYFGAEGNASRFQASSPLSESDLDFREVHAAFGFVGLANLEIMHKYDI